MFRRICLPLHSIELDDVLRPLAVAALCFGLSAPLRAESSSTSHQASPAKEESVLVATRDHSVEKAKAEETAFTESVDSEISDEKLEPISQSSDRAPEVAADTEPDSAKDAKSNSKDDAKAKTNDDASTQFDDVLAKAAAPKSEPATSKVENPEPRDVPEPEPIAAGGSARRAAAAKSQPVAFEPVKFQGVCVGKTSKHELITAWGQPAESAISDEGDVLTFKKAPFKSVEVLIGGNDVVSTIKVTLATPLDAKKLSEQLNLGKLEPLNVTDDMQATVCHAYPERGVLFMLEQNSSVTPVTSESRSLDAHRVSQVVLQPIDAKAFAYRAESHLHGPYAQNIGDLKTSIALDPEFARAYWLLARIYLATGQADLANAAAAEACDIEAENASYQLCHAETRALLGEYDDAVVIVRGVLDRKDVTSVDRAQALHQMGQLASFGDREIASKAISFENQAIEAADKLTTSSDVHERHAAKQLLVEAHLAIAEEVARQPFNKKVESLSEWFGRASGLAEEYIEKDNGSVELRLIIAQRALNALASFKPTLDPAPWIAEAEEAAQKLQAQSSDELWQQQIKWELGIAYLHALRIEHTRRETEAALKYGQHAIDNLSVGASQRQAVHSTELLVGQLYFQMGAVYAVHKLDHAKAVQWYDKSVPLITSKWPASELVAPRREGEMLVSMGVSYWQTGDKSRALELTKTGVGLVETAVQGGVLEKKTLAVPYGNLASMYDQMGEAINAAKYNELAKSVGAEDQVKSDAKSKPQQPRVGRRQMSQTRQMRTR